jgi:hypothetical protein
MSVIGTGVGVGVMVAVGVGGTGVALGPPGVWVSNRGVAAKVGKGPGGPPHAASAATKSRDIKERRREETIRF